MYCQIKCFSNKEFFNVYQTAHDCNTVVQTHRKTSISPNLKSQLSKFHHSRKMTVTRRIISTFNRRYSPQSLNFVPKHSPVVETDVRLLEDFLLGHRKILVLTGAGISTESGIPDYRSEEVGLYARSNHKPIQYQVFLKSEEARRRYWARNYVGWERFSRCEPNDTHRFVKELEVAHRKASVVVTQNVDRLHYKAGSRNVVELHGSAFRVKCLQCDANYSRFEVQEALKELNPEFGESSSMIRPDGDVEIAEVFFFSKCSHYKRC